MLGRGLVFQGILFCSLGSALSGEPMAPVSDSTPVPAELVVRARKIIKELSSENFDTRQEALDALKKLPLTLLPWVKQTLHKKDESSGLDQQTRASLAKLLLDLENRNQMASLTYGSPVTLDLKDVELETILKEIEKQTRNPPLEFGLGSDNKKWDFRYTGPYWGAIHHLLRMINSKGPERTYRENIFGERPFNRWNVEDTLFWKMPKGTAGVASVRIARMAWERGAGGEFLIVTAVPIFEARYAVNEMSMSIEELVLGEALKLKPIKGNLVWQTKWSNGIDYIPGKDFTWAFPVDAPFSPAALKTSAKLSGKISATVVALRTLDVDLKKKADTYKILENISATIMQSSSTEFKIRFEGPGNRPKHFSYGLRGDASILVCLDAEGNKLNFNVNSTRSGSSNNWHLELGGRVTAEVAQIRVIVPEKKQTVTLPFTIQELILPLSGVLKDDPIPKK